MRSTYISDKIFQSVLTNDSRVIIINGFTSILIHASTGWTVPTYAPSPPHAVKCPVPFQAQ